MFILSSIFLCLPCIWNDNDAFNFFSSIVSFAKVAKRVKSKQSMYLSHVGWAAFASPNPRLGPKDICLSLLMVASGLLSPVASQVTFAQRRSTFSSGLAKMLARMGSKYVDRSSPSPMVVFIFDGSGWQFLQTILGRNVISTISI